MEQSRGIWWYPRDHFEWRKFIDNVQKFLHTAATPQERAVLRLAWVEYAEGRLVWTETPETSKSPYQAFCECLLADALDEQSVSRERFNAARRKAFPVLAQWLQQLYGKGVDY